jgi:tetratricopeptide (TPR) repeat protein
MTKHARLPSIDRAPAADTAASRVPRLRTRYYAFLSYSHRDKALADWLHRELERFRVPHSLAGRLTANGVVPRRLTPIFRVQQDLSAGADLGEEIKAALAASQFLIVLCSPTAATSRWTNAEIESFKRTRPEGCVLAAVVAGEPFTSDIPGREAEECFPPALRYKYDRRGHQTAKRAEPLAADFRDSGEGQRIALLKLIAGMLGVGLDELVQRDTTRRHRQLAWLATGSLAGMAIASTLAVAAIQARDAARDQRREAEGLVAFMLGDLKDKLEPIGRLDALDGVGSRVLAYYSKQDASELSDAALIQRARALSLTAQVAYLRGNMDGAQRLYREAMAGTGEAVSRSPDDPHRLFDHAQNVFWIGELARKRGETNKAEAAYREYKRLADRMVAIDPNNLKWRMEVQYARENLGIVLMSQRRFAEALGQFSAVASAIESMRIIDSDSKEYQSELSNGYGWLADASKALGRLNGAIAVRQRQVAYLNRLIAAGNSDVALHQQLIVAHQALGVLFTSRGQAEAGIGEYRRALAKADELLAVEPSNRNWRDLSASVQLELAKNLVALGRVSEAAQEAAAGCGTAADLRARAADVARWRTLQTTCLSVRARLTLASGATAQALALAQQALAAAHSENTGDPVADRYIVAAASRLLGDIRAREGDRTGAMAAWSAGLAGLPQNVTERPWEINERAELLRRLGRVDEARPLAGRLAAIGFKSST